MNARKASTRLLSFLLALCMVFGMMPMTAFADEVETTSTEPVAQTEVEESTTAGETVADDATTESASEETTEDTTEEVTEETTEAATEETTEETTEEVTEETTEATTEETTEEVTEETTEAATEETTEVIAEEHVAFFNVSLLAEDPDAPQSVVVEGATSSETREVYVQVNSVSAAGDYLFVSANSATTSANMLTASSNGVTNTSNVTVTTAANAAGTNVTYIENPTANAIWTASSDGNGWTLLNSSTDRYLRCNNNNGNLTSTDDDDNATTWYSGTNTLYRQGGGGGGSSNYRYVRYSSSWGTSNSSADVYIYQKQNVAFPITVNGTYSIAGEDVEKVVVEGSTATLSSTLTFVPESGSTKTTDTSTTATYTVYSDDAGIISGIEGNTLTFTGVTGEAVVKVSYTMTFGEKSYTVTNFINVTAKEPAYIVEITEDDEIVTETLTVKNVTAESTLQLGELVTYEDANGTNTVTPAEGSITWTSSNEAIATVDNTGLVSFTGANGKINISVTYTVDGKEITDIITVSASTSQYFVPEDGTNDFPEYPNEGAIRIDKNAQAVGNFSDTGVAKVELSMTGVPYSAGNEIDVVIMIDMSNSMTEDTNGVADRVTPARNAANSALEAIVKNEDGTINNNRVAVYTFNGYDGTGTQNYANAVDEVLSLQSYQNTDNTSDTTRLTNAKSSITTAIQEDETDSGTNYGAALEKCYSVLNAARAEYPNRKQFVIFVTDGEPTTGFAYETEDGSVADDGYNTQYGDGAADKYYTYTEYYSKQMRAAGVEVYSVGIQLVNNNANTILKKIGGNSTGTAYANADTHGDYAQFIDADESADKLIEIFEGIVNAIKEAATDVTVTDKITDQYTLILEAPENVTLSDGTALTIDVLQYTLDENKNRTGDPVVIESVSLDDIDKVTIADGKITKIEADTFTYDATTHIITWKADKLDTKELALSYYVYLNKSAGYEAEDQTAAGTYPTNDYAHITYTNHLDHECQKYFAKPQLTWNGAQVSYTFYLVNSQGQPVNRAGRVIPFAEAVYVTDVYTQSVTWDSTDAESFNASMIAQELLPEVYELYDANTSYTINVYENEAGQDLGNNFIIVGGNTIANADTYTTKVFNTKAGTIYSAPGTYIAGEEEGKIQVHTGFDFANTTVAFAVVWKNELAEDTVVIDYGLDVVIDVTANDALEAKVVGVRATAPANVTINSGNYNAAESDSVEVKLDETVMGTASVENASSVRFSLNKDNGTQMNAPVVFYYESEASYYGSDNVLTTTDLYSSVTVIPATTVYFEDSFLTLTNTTGAEQNELTVLNGNPDSGYWYQVGSTIEATQDVDRPGVNKITETYDADNAYGYDSAYTECSQYSLGSAVMAHVDAATSAKASFSFYGTGFDVIGLTSNQTGTIIVNVKNADGSVNKNYIVDTYYGYTLDDSILNKVTYTYWGVDENGNEKWSASTEEVAYSADLRSESKPENPEIGVTQYTVYLRCWKTTTNDPNALYQVPVMKVSGLTYGQYTATITATYNEYFDHTSADGYDLYLDAIRIYDPCGSNDTANNAYAADGEGWPLYQELRNLVISANDFNAEDVTDVTGIVFIDGGISEPSISDYTSYGPNNELYLAPGQSIAFKIADSFVKTSDGATSLTPVDVQLAVKTVGDTATISMFNVSKTTSGSTTTWSQTNNMSFDVETATDMYYSIKTLSDGIIVISNSGSTGILSITNLKFTFAESAAVKVADETSEDNADTVESAIVISSADATDAIRALTFCEITTDVADKITSETEATEESTEATEEPTEEATEPETEETKPQNGKPGHKENKPKEDKPANNKPEQSTNHSNGFQQIFNKVVNGAKKLFEKLFR